jgi:hypothetical protein
MIPPDELEELTLVLLSHLSDTRSAAYDQALYDVIETAASLHDSGKTRAYWQDYVTGLASTMSFLPTPPQPTFHDSDRAALASDWLKVESDLNQAWQAATAAESDCDEYGERWKFQIAE